MSFPDREISPTPWSVKDFQGFGKTADDAWAEAIIVDANGNELWIAEPAEACGMSWADAERIVALINEDAILRKYNA